MKQLSVLAVEDERLNVSLLHVAFELEGIRLRTVTTGIAGVEAATRDAPDLVLLNVRLPDISGLEAARRIRALPGRAARVPILGCSAFAGRADEARALEAGMTAYLPKPAPPTTVLAAIRALVATRGEIEAPRRASVAALLADLGLDRAERFVDASAAALARLGGRYGPQEPATVSAGLEELAPALRRFGLERTAAAMVAAAAAFPAEPGAAATRMERIAGEAALWRAGVFGVHGALGRLARGAGVPDDCVPQR
ncbi:MAG: response regulator [Paracoccaceae bacterium]